MNRHGIPECPECHAWMVPPYEHQTGCEYVARRDYVLAPPRLWRGIAIGLALELAAAAAIYLTWKALR